MQLAHLPLSFFFFPKIGNEIFIDVERYPVIGDSHDGQIFKCHGHVYDNRGQL